jgi:hypothetical protein
MKPKIIKLQPNEQIIAVVPKRAGGPGWSNAITWVYIENSSTGACYAEGIQPEERTEAMDALYAIGEAVHNALLNAVPSKRVKGAK